MTNAAPLIRTAFVSALSGLAYDSAPVPVYDNEGTGAGREVILADCNRSDVSNKNLFIGKYEQLVEVVCVQDKSYRRHVDAIGQLILTTIKPSPKECGLTLAGVTLGHVALVGHSYLDEPTESNSVVVRLLLRFEITITE